MSELTTAMDAYEYACRAYVFAKTEYQIDTANLLLENAKHKLRKALAQPAEQQPVGYFLPPIDESDVWEEAIDQNCPTAVALYAKPVQANMTLDVLRPRNWTREMSDAWHKAIPNLEKAFDDLITAFKEKNKITHDNPIKHTTADNYEHFLSYMYGSGARHNALLCQAYFDGSNAPHEEYEAYMAAHPEHPPIEYSAADLQEIARLMKEGRMVMPSAEFPYAIRQHVRENGGFILRITTAISRNFFTEYEKWVARKRAKLSQTNTKTAQ